MSELKFNEEKHIYELDGIELPSVSKILQQTGISPNLDGIIDPKYAEEGTRIHAEIEAWFKNEEAEITPAVSQVIGCFANFRIATQECEVMLHSEKYKYAGRPDFVAETDKGRIIVDFKSGKMQKEAVAWQLSLYAQAYEEQESKSIDGVYCVDGLRSGKGELHKLERKSEEKILNLITAFRLGRSMVEQESTQELIPAADGKMMCEWLERIAELSEMQKEAEDKIKDIKQKLLTAMLEHQVKKIDIEGWSFTAVDATKRETVDSKKLKEKYVDVYADCLKISDIKPTLKITGK